MDPNLLQLIIAAGLTVVGLLIVVLIWRRAKWRTIVTWLGLALLPLGLYLLGLVPALIDGWNTLVNWYWTTMAPWSDPLRIAGAVVGGLAVLFLLISRFIPPKPRVRREPTDTATPVRRERPVYDDRAVDSGPEDTAKLPAGATRASDEDAEVTEILKKRGIS